MKIQAENICNQVKPALHKYFNKFEIFSVEESLMEDMNEIKSFGKKFKGFIDMIIKTEDGRYHIIDWKTCSWGWPSQKKSDPIINYQLTFYKNFFCKKHNIDPKKVDTYFGLLKRTAKKENVEILRTTSGPKKTTNALKILENAVINIDKGNYIKNRLNCKYCKFYKTEKCK
jgi:ATP-dependent exoDNAse (exonuclease V) beta subunit